MTVRIRRPASDTRTPRQRQEDRQKYNFPKDRLAFYPRAASADCASLKQYREGQINFAMLCAEVARNNLLDHYFDFGVVPERMMRNELKILGWERPGL